MDRHIKVLRFDRLTSYLNVSFFIEKNTVGEKIKSNSALKSFCKIRGYKTKGSIYETVLFRFEVPVDDAQTV